MLVAPGRAAAAALAAIGRAGDAEAKADGCGGAAAAAVEGVKYCGGARGVGVVAEAAGVGIATDAGPATVERTSATAGPGRPMRLLKASIALCCSLRRITCMHVQRCRISRDRCPGSYFYVTQCFNLAHQGGSLSASLAWLKPGLV